MSRTGRPLLGLTAVGLGTLAAPLDSAVNIAFPAITAAFGLPVEDIRWVVICYVLTYSSLMLVCGKLGDVLGYRRIFLAGLVVGSAGFATCALAPSYPALLGARVLQGVGVALILSCGPALSTSLFDEEKRTRILGVYAAIMATGGALGPLVFGWLVERFGWQVVFAARVPLVLAALALSFAIPAPAKGATMRGFDVAGALLMIAWSVALLLAVAAHSTPLGAGLQAGLAIVAAVAFAAFLLTARRHPSPIIRPALFADGRFLAMNLASIIVNFAAFSILLLVPFWLARAAELPSRLAGVVLSLSAVGVIAGASLAGRVAPRVGAGRLAVAGILISAAGLGAISSWSAGTAVPAMAVALLAHGLGLGLFQVAYTDLVVATLPIADRGVAGSLTMVTRTIGVVGAATGLSAAHRHFEGLALAAGMGARDAFVAGFTTTFRGVAIGLAASLLVWLSAWAMGWRGRAGVGNTR